MLRGGGWLQAIYGKPCPAGDERRPVPARDGRMPDNPGMTRLAAP